MPACTGTGGRAFLPPTRPAPPRRVRAGGGCPPHCWRLARQRLARRRDPSALGCCRRPDTQVAVGDTQGCSPDTKDCSPDTQGCSRDTQGCSLGTLELQPGYIGVAAWVHWGCGPLLPVAAGEEPLDAAPRRAMLRALLRAGASARARDGAGRTALHAAAAGHAEAVEELVGAGGGEAGSGVEAGALDAQGRSALELALGGSHLAAARALLRGGAPCCDRARQLARDARESSMLVLLDTACAALLGD